MKADAPLGGAGAALIAAQPDLATADTRAGLCDPYLRSAPPATTLRHSATLVDMLLTANRVPDASQEADGARSHLALAVGEIIV